MADIIDSNFQDAARKLISVLRTNTIFQTFKFKYGISIPEESKVNLNKLWGYLKN